MEKKKIERIDDEIDLYNFALKMWNGRSDIIASILVFLVISSIYLMQAKEVYQSEITYKKILNYKHINYFDDNPLEHFFFQNEYFNQWKQTTKSQSISYSDFSRESKYQDNFFEKDKSNLEVLFTNEYKDSNDDESKIIIYSNNIKKILDYKNYLNFLNSLVTKDLIKTINLDNNLIHQSRLLAQKNINYTLAASLDESERKNKMLLNFLKDKYLYRIDVPTIPKLVSMNKSLIIFLGAMTGLIFGLFLVAIKDYFSRK